MELLHEAVGYRQTFQTAIGPCSHQPFGSLAANILGKRRSAHHFVIVGRDGRYGDLYNLLTWQRNSILKGKSTPADS